MSEGYIKLYRKMTGWGWYDDPITKVVFLDLLLHAAWDETEYHGLRIMPGECVVGRKILAKRLGITEQNVRTAIAHLESTGEVTKKVTNKFTVVTIENWASYQGCEGEINQPSNQQVTSTFTDSQPTTNQQLTIKPKPGCVGKSMVPGDTVGDANQQPTNNQPTTNQQLTTYKEYKNIYKDSISTNVDISQKVEPSDFATAWNSICIDLPKVKTMTDSRRRKIHARLEDFTQEDILEAMRLIQESDFLSGREGGWKANFDWLFLNSTNMAKVLEGNYVNKPPRKTKTENDFEAARRRIQEQYERVTQFGERTASG